MNELSTFLVDNILNENVDQVTALFGGGFKPPTKGHLEVVLKGLQQSPEVNNLKILVGKKERNGFTQDQSVKIWNFYNDINLIPVPTDVIAVNSPFSYYKEYLKEHPNDKTYIFIGSRPEDEKDQMDVKQRSEFVKKYSDNVIPIEVSTTGGVSGTEARKLFKTDLDGFRNMFPENLTKGDWIKIQNILRGKSIDSTSNQLSTKTEPLSPLNENASYSNHIDYKQQIKDLTKHMIKKGMNILPLPRVIFKNGDQENASQFLGKTAYYSPSDMTVVLYTEGRHPKDIVRSFAHEMIHHIQNLEDRLENISTTNTMEDDNLNDIEREAYTKGNMTFRNWTDSIDGEEVTSLKEKNKDPFGLNQFARELVKETFSKTVTIDMGPIIKALEFEMPTGQETDENVIAIIDAAPTGKVPHSVFLDFYAKFDKYFGEENDNRMLDNFGLEYLLSKVLNLPNEDIQIVINHYNTTDQDSVEWFEQHDNELEKDEEYNIPGFDDSGDDYDTVINYRKKQLSKSLEEQKEDVKEDVKSLAPQENDVIFNKNCGCDKT